LADNCGNLFFKINGDEVNNQKIIIIISHHVIRVILFYFNFNSVLAGLRDRKFEVIHEEISDIVSCKVGLEWDN
jgi:hypothetical protein